MERPDDAQLARRRRRQRDDAVPAEGDTPSGPIWHRFTFDGYGEQPNGDDWDLFFDNPARQTRGRLWPLLTGERGEYELIAGRSARPHLQTIANTANDGLMLPEQVWDDQPPPGERSGASTRSSGPLAWTHGQFIRLAWSIDAGGRSSARRSSPAATSGSFAPAELSCQCFARLISDAKHFS